MPLSDADRHQLRSFRKAARQIRDASIIAEGRTIELVTRPGEPGYVDIFVKLLAEEPFRSLALAIRLAYMQREPAYFTSVCKLLHRIGGEAVRNRVTVLREQYRAALRDPANQVVVGDGANRVVYTAQEVFDHWLCGIAFHQDHERQEAVQQLASIGYGFPWSVQATALQLAGRILDLDDVIADHLGEPRVERL